MIKAKVNDGMVSLKMSGDIPQLMANMITLVRSVYDALSEKDEDKANSFKRLFKFSVEMGVPFMDINDLEEAVIELQKAIESEE